MGKSGVVAVVLVVLALTGCTSTPTQDADYLASVGHLWKGAAEPTPAQYVAAGHAACGQMNDGIARDAVKVIDALNYDSELNNIHIVRAAITAYCPDRA